MPRIRKKAQLRDLVSETSLSIKDFIAPYFVMAGEERKEPIPSLPGVYKFSIDRLLEDLSCLSTAGLRAILLFGVAETKYTDEQLDRVYLEDGLVQRAIRAIKQAGIDVVIFSDLCLCNWTVHSHCGVLKKEIEAGGDFIDTEATVELLTKIGLSYAASGVDFVAPSAMMDGQVQSLRQGLDREGFSDVGIMAYSAKYLSNFYQPFRDVLNSAPQFADRSGYQMDYRNGKEALSEIETDIREGADIVMVKPALSYLDIIYAAKRQFNIPLAAYNVSGEYAMARLYAQGDSQMEKAIVLEMLTGIKRAGADIIISYWTKDLIKWLGE